MTETTTSVLATSLQGILAICSWRHTHILHISSYTHYIFAMFASLGRSIKKQDKHDDDMTVWVPKGVYNSVEPLWDKRYAWHPMAVDDSLPIDQTSFIQVDKDNNNNNDDEEGTPESQQAAATASGHERLAPEEPSADTASIHSAVSTLGELPSNLAGGPQSRSTQPRRSDFGFPVRQMTWNTSRRKRAAQLQRQKSRDKYGVPGKPSKVPAALISKPAPALPRETIVLAGEDRRADARRLSRTAPESLGGDFVMFAL